jgi:two-component SAPR family response regulator
VLLEVRALGSGQVLIDGRQITQWDGALPRSLFFYFVDRGMTTRDEVFATFWPELSTREATNVFHVTKRKISEILGVDLTVYSSGFYRISPEIELHYDVVAFGESVQNSAVAEPEEAYELLDRAIALHERDFLSAVDQAWANKRRDELRRTYVDALTAQARIYEGRDMLAEALGLYNRAFGAFPQREDLARAQMRLYHQAGQPQRAMLVYHRLVKELQQSLDVVPSPETTTLAEQIEAQND